MPELVLLIGLPGSGKSTFITNNYNYDRIFLHNTIILSSDKIREEKFGNVNDQTHNAEVFDYIKEETVKALEKGFRVVIDATNITVKARKSITDYVEQNIISFYDYGLIRYIIMATPYYKCLENNRKRSRQVPEEVIERMYKQFEFPNYTETVHTIDIAFPFELDKDMYKVEHPYERLKGLSHETPYHKLSIGQHLQKSYEIMKQLTTDKILLKAAELHDIGKPFCKQYIEGTNQARYLNHANVGSYEAIFYAKMLKFTADETVDLCNLIRFHMRAHDCEDKEKASEKLKLAIGEKLYYKLLLLKLVDREAH